MKTVKIIVYLLIAFTWSWVNWFTGLQYLSAGNNDKAIGHFVTFFFIGVYGPAISSVITTLYFDGLKGLVGLLKRLLVLKAPAKVYLAIILLPVFILASAIGLYYLFVGQIGRVDFTAIFAVPGLLLVALLAGPLGEELGWRGLLLPELQKKYSAVVSSLIVGIIWYCWHIPLFFAPFGTLVSGAPLTFFPLLVYLVFVICLALINTWLFNNSKGSVLITILMHLSVNAGLLLLFFPALKDNYKLLYLLATPALLLFTVWLGWKTAFKNKNAAPISG